MRTETKLLGGDFDANENQQLEFLPQSDFSRVPERFHLSVRANSITVNFVYWKLGPLYVFVVIQRMFSSWVRQRTVRFLFKDCQSFYFHSLIKSNFLVSKGLLCLYDKQKIHVCLSIRISLTVFNSTSHLRKNLSSTRQNRQQLLVVDFRSQPDCSICRKEAEKENE